jgi:hypothetical protein
VTCPKNPGRKVIVESKRGTSISTAVLGEWGTTILIPVFRANDMNFKIMQGRDKSRKLEACIVQQSWLNCDSYLRIGQADKKVAIAWEVISTFVTKSVYPNLAQVAHICNPSYSGGRDQEDPGSKPAWENNSQDYLKKTLHKNGLLEWLKCRP